MILAFFSSVTVLLFRTISVLNGKILAVDLLLLLVLKLRASPPPPPFFLTPSRNFYLVNSQ